MCYINLRLLTYLLTLIAVVSSFHEFSFLQLYWYVNYSILMPAQRRGGGQYALVFVTFSELVKLMMDANRPQIAMS